MPVFNKVMVILGVMYCSRLVYSDRVRVAEKAYNFGDRTVHTGKEHINGSSMVYALCRSSSDNRRVACSLNFESNVFSNQVRTCSFDAVTELANGKIEILEIRQWRSDKLIFMFRDINLRNIKETKVSIATVIKRDCEKSVLKLNVDNRSDMKPQIFIFTSRNTYDVVFMDSIRCGHEFCKMTVDLSDVVSGPVNWFPNIGLVHALEPTNDNSQKFFINEGETSINRGVTNIYLLGPEGWKILGSYDDVSNLGWSTANNIISYCTFSDCRQFDHAGGSEALIIFGMDDNPTLYVVLHNLPNREFLALICDTDDNSTDNYHVIRFGPDGYLKNSFDIHDLSCLRKPETLTAKFFEKNEREYCLSIFYSVEHLISRPNVSHLFKIYCFPV